MAFSAGISAKGRRRRWRDWTNGIFTAVARVPPAYETCGCCRAYADLRRTLYHNINCLQHHRYARRGSALLCAVLDRCRLASLHRPAGFLRTTSVRYAFVVSGRPRHIATALTAVPLLSTLPCLEHASLLLTDDSGNLRCLPSQYQAMKMNRRVSPGDLRTWTENEDEKEERRWDSGGGGCVGMPVQCHPMSLLLTSMVLPFSTTFPASFVLLRRVACGDRAVLLSHIFSVSLSNANEAA